LHSLYLLFWYKGQILKLAFGIRNAGAHFTHCTGTKGQILTLEEERRLGIALLCLYSRQLPPSGATGSKKIGKKIAQLC
jgi:hypothetical protein